MKKVFKNLPLKFQKAFAYIGNIYYNVVKNFDAGNLQVNF